jgi:transposase
LPARLPQQRIEHVLEDADRKCPCCGEELEKIGEENAEQLEYVPASLIVLEHARFKYACTHCHEHVTTAAKLPAPIAAADA